MIDKPLRIMEYFWIFLALLTFALFIFESFRSGLKNSYIFLIFSAISYLMYYWRKTLREKQENENS